MIIILNMYVCRYIYVEEIISVKCDMYVHVMYIYSECIGSLLITTYVLNRTLYLRGGLTSVHRKRLLELSTMIDVM